MHVLQAESWANGGVLRGFNGLALLLLHQSHKVCHFPPFLGHDSPVTSSLP